MLWVAMTLAFFGFLRLKEMTCNSPYSPAIHLSPCDITFLPNSLSPEHMSVRIKVSKTDPFRSGHTIIVGKTAQPICPVRAMQVFLSFRETSPGPLFQYLSRSPLTKAGLTSETRQLLSMSGLQPSQYRIGLLQPLPKSASPLGLSKLWGGGPLTATKDIFNVPILSFLGSRVSC